MNVRESVCESVCVCERGNVRDCVREGGQRERECLCVCVCVCVYVYMCVWVGERVGVKQKQCKSACQRW